jgi:hypothetical protein
MKKDDKYKYSLVPTTSYLRTPTDKLINMCIELNVWLHCYKAKFPIVSNGTKEDLITDIINEETRLYVEYNDDKKDIAQVIKSAFERATK